MWATAWLSIVIALTAGFGDLEPNEVSGTADWLTPLAYCMGALLFATSGPAAYRIGHRRVFLVAPLVVAAAGLLGVWIAPAT